MSTDHHLNVDYQRGYAAAYNRSVWERNALQEALNEINADRAKCVGLCEQFRAERDEARQAAAVLLLRILKVTDVTLGEVSWLRQETTAQHAAGGIDGRQ